MTPMAIWMSTARWVMMFRGNCLEEIGTERRQHLHRYADLGYKAAIARERGAVGIILVSGPECRHSRTSWCRSASMQRQQDPSHWRDLD